MEAEGARGADPEVVQITSPHMLSAGTGSCDHARCKAGWEMQSSSAPGFAQVPAAAETTRSVGISSSNPPNCHGGWQRGYPHFSDGKAAYTAAGEVTRQTLRISYLRYQLASNRQWVLEI